MLLVPWLRCILLLLVKLLLWLWGCFIRKYGIVSIIIIIVIWRCFTIKLLLTIQVVILLSFLLNFVNYLSLLVNLISQGHLIVIRGTILIIIVAIEVLKVTIIWLEVHYVLVLRSLYRWNIRGCTWPASAPWWWLVDALCFCSNRLVVVGIIQLSKSLGWLLPHLLLIMNYEIAGSWGGTLNGILRCVGKCLFLLR